jgi:predicted HicB family RNase H-like nuclease
MFGLLNRAKRGMRCFSMGIPSPASRKSGARVSGQGRLRIPATERNHAMTTMNTIKDRNYAARIDCDPDDRIFVGHLAGIRDIVGFHGESVADLEASFHEAVEDDRSMCEQLGQPPDLPASGKLMLRIPP